MGSTANFARALLPHCCLSSWCFFTCLLLSTDWLLCLFSACMCPMTVSNSDPSSPTLAPSQFAQLYCLTTQLLLNSAAGFQLQIPRDCNLTGTINKHVDQGHCSMRLEEQNSIWAFWKSLLEKKREKFKILLGRIRECEVWNTLIHQC